jgi:hypothetical protein
MSSLDQLWDDMATSLSTAAGEHDSLAARCHCCVDAVVWLLDSELFLASLCCCLLLIGIAILNKDDYDLPL